MQSGLFSNALELARVTLTLGLTLDSHPPATSPFLFRRPTQPASSPLFSHATPVLCVDQPCRVVFLTASPYDFTFHLQPGPTPLAPISLAGPSGSQLGSTHSQPFLDLQALGFVLRLTLRRSISLVSGYGANSYLLLRATPCSGTCHLRYASDLARAIYARLWGASIYHTTLAASWHVGGVDSAARLIGSDLYQPHSCSIYSRVRH